MKRVMGLLTVATLQVLIGAGTALAQASYPPPVKPPVVEGTHGGGTAFTGGNVSFGAVATLSLLAVGLLALFVARRRAARLAG
jgi:hypothetical protein